MTASKTVAAPCRASRSRARALHRRTRVQRRAGLSGPDKVVAVAGHRWLCSHSLLRSGASATALGCTAGTPAYVRATRWGGVHYLPSSSPLQCKYCKGRSNHSDQARLLAVHMAACMLGRLTCGHDMALQRRRTAPSLPRLIVRTSACTTVPSPVRRAQAQAASAIGVTTSPGHGHSARRGAMRGTYHTHTHVS